jgi:Domain of unknown function (DUF4136)
MKQRPVTLTGIVVLIIAMTACATLEVGSDYDRQASFANYHTFAIMERQHRNANAQNPLVSQRAEDAIVNDLTGRGYQLVTDRAAADFVVDFTIGSRERTDINTYPTPYATMGWTGWGYGPGWWGTPYWGTDVDVRQVREGTLSIDVFDGRSHRPVWHGWAKKELSRSDIEQSEEPIRKAVAAVLAKFPPGHA